MYFYVIRHFSYSYVFRISYSYVFRIKKQQNEDLQRSHANSSVELSVPQLDWRVMKRCVGFIILNSFETIRMLFLTK